VDEDGIFAGKGEETRQLLGYHITPSDLTDDEKKIKELRADYSDYWEQENLAAIGNLYADSWYSSCEDKTARMQELADSFAAYENIANFASISDIVINGDEAKCMIQRLAVGMVAHGTGSEWVTWSRSNAHMIKEGSEWKYYGNQIGFQIGWMFAWTRKYPDESRFLDLVAAMRDCAGDLADKDSEITSLTVTGPPGTFTDLDLAAEWNPDWLEYWLEEDISKAQNGFYTFRLVDYLGNILETTDYLVVMPPLDIPNLVSPVNDAVVPPGYVALDWDDVDGADYYRVDLERDVDGSWIRESAWPSESQAVFILPGATDFRWRVRARQRDLYGESYDNESRSGWAYFSTETGTVNVIDPSDDGSIYSDGNVITDAYLMADGSIHGVVEFSLDSITTDSIIEATLSINPYLLPLQDETVDIFGYESNDGILTSNDYNAGTFLGTWVMPEGLGFGEDTFFDVTDFIRTVDSPYVGFSLRANNTDSFSSLEYNYGHPARLVTVIP
jgi:hypothetical protein